TKTKFLPPNYTARINPAGKTYREVLVEYLQVVDNSKPEDVVLDKTRGLLYVKMPLHARLLLWWEKPTLKRWPWSDPGP
ncbi:MAG: hypothetical protein LBV28_06020, partial [Puniceicoccales bacterium]|nr:hypothetical protein [Puniceicoccales bacterium]